MRVRTKNIKSKKMKWVQAKEEFTGHRDKI